MRGKNIVQAEFFHVGNKIKTNVRFYDDGTITAFAKEVVRLERFERALAKAIVSARGIHLKLLNALHRRILKKRLDRTEGIALLVYRGLRAEVVAGADIGYERIDRSFRPATSSEAQYLLQAAYIAARNERSTWVFVFEPNDLFADNNQSVVYVM